MNSRRRISPFSAFLILWLTLLAIGLGAALYSFRSFLLDYEAVYPRSLPEAEMDQILVQLSTADTAGVLRLVTALPEPAAGESEEDMEYAFIQFLDKAELSYRRTEQNEQAVVSFDILDKDLPVGRARFRQNPVSTLPYQLPSWYLSTLEFYSLPAAG